MKLKFKQGVYISGIDQTVAVGQEIDVPNEVQAQSLIDADFAELVVEEQPKTPSKETPEKTKEVKPKVKATKEKVGE